MNNSLLVLTLIAVGTHPAHSVPPDSTAPEAAASARGETVYIGTVFPLKSAATEPTFVYERTVAERDGALVSTHVTRDPSGATVIHESATHSADYALFDYTLHVNQLGQTGTIRVENDQVFFEYFDGTKRHARVDHEKGPVVVGPTLVGYIVRHLESLRAGKELGIRLAVLDRLETIGFELQAVEAQPGQTRIRMKPSSFLIAMLVDPLYFTFEAATAKLIRLEGRVPPKIRDGDAWRDFDARIEYRFVASSYR